MEKNFILAKPAASARVLGILLAGCMGMAALLALVPAAGHDQLWFLLMAERWLDGAALYGPQATDPNTPMVIWLSAMPVLLARALHIAIPAMAKLCVVLLLAAGGLASYRLLRRMVPVMTRAQVLFLAIAFAVVAAVAPARDFGQRDPLAALLCLPYLLATAAFLGTAKKPSPIIAMAFGALTGTAVWLKPQLVLVPIAVELLLLFTRRRTALKRVEPWTILLTGCAILLAVKLTAPLYFSSALPAARATYWAIGHLRPLQLMAEAPQLYVLAAIAIGLAWVRRGSAQPFEPAIRLLLLAGLAATLAYYLQGTGWYYQQLPAITFFGLALAMELLSVEPPRALLEAPWTTPAAAVLVALALALTWHFSGFPFAANALTDNRTYAISTPDPSFFTALPPGTAVATLTTSVDDAIMPVWRYRLTWAQRTDNLWQMPAILRAPNLHINPAQLADLSAQQRRWMVEDLTHWQPQLVLVERCQDADVTCQHLEGRHDDLLAFFLADPAFAAVWSHYRFTRSTGPYDAYTLSAP